MTIDIQEALARIHLLRRVIREHEPISFRSVPAGEKFDPHSGRTVQSYSFERNDRLRLMAETGDAARLELEETYRVISVTDDMPDDVVFELLQVRMRDAGGEEGWYEKISGMNVPEFEAKWLRKHLEEFAKERTKLDELVRVSLMFEDVARERSLEKAA